MSCLSFKSDGLLVVAANPVFVISSNDNEFKRGSEVKFEVFEQDAGTLRPLIGADQLYAMDGMTFLSRLNSLTPCKSTHPGLALLRDKATLRGVFSIIEDAIAVAQ